VEIITEKEIVKDHPLRIGLQGIDDIIEVDLENEIYDRTKKDFREVGRK
jgi:hypothetical protein